MHKFIELDWYSDAKFYKAVAWYCLLSDLHCLEKEAEAFEFERLPTPFAIIIIIRIIKGQEVPKPLGDADVHPGFWVLPHPMGCLKCFVRSEVLSCIHLNIPW